VRFYFAWVKDGVAPRYTSGMSSDPSWRHGRLPDHSTLLVGRTPPDEVGFPSDRLQIWYNNTTEAWTDPAPHFHQDSDEVFIVLSGTLEVTVEGNTFTVGPREFCHFPVGVVHSVVAVFPPAETFMIRAPSINDKVQIPD